MRRLVIIGGSTPFTARLVDAFREQHERLTAHQLVLYGRNSEDLDLVAGYAHAQLDELGWQIDYSTDLRSALRGANIVLHQPRYGGMEARATGEKISQAFDLPPDETLGPGALYCAIQLIPELDRVSAMLARQCPDAWVLNLTNPLSLATARMVRQGVQRCVGLCELPRVTFEQVASMLGKDASNGSWSYTGLNHRGFITELFFDGRNHIAEFARALGSAQFNGVPAERITALRAIPTKYFRLFGLERAGTGKSRSDFLSQLRTRIKQELRSNPRVSPPSLNSRYMAWYDRSVVPMIAALTSADGSLEEVNQLVDNGLVEEGRAWVDNNGISHFTKVEASKAVGNWLDILRHHERLAMRAADNPDMDTIVAALDADPLMASRNVSDCARRISRELNVDNLTNGPHSGESRRC